MCSAVLNLLCAKDKKKYLVGAISGPETDVEFRQEVAEHDRLHQLSFARRLSGLDFPDSTFDNSSLLTLMLFECDDSELREEGISYPGWNNTVRPQSRVFDSTANVYPPVGSPWRSPNTNLRGANNQACHLKPLRQFRRW